jgi:hypothetical protein
MSHAQPLEAGMDCLFCHYKNERQNAGMPDRGMEVCLKCHNNETTSSECTICHDRHPLSQLRTESAKMNFATDLLEGINPQEYCYGCHDTGPCDACHRGIRMPHTKDFMEFRPEGHAAHSKGINVQPCFYCHNDRSTQGATDCYDCHARNDF